MKSLVIVLSIGMVLLATTGIVGAKALYDKACEPHYVYYHDTAYIDSTRPKVNPEKWYQYQVELSNDSLYVFDAQRLVSILNARECGKLDSVLLNDNQ